MQYELAGWRLRRDNDAVPVQRPASWRPKRADSADDVQSQSAGEFSLAQGCQSFNSIQAFNRLDEAH